MRQLQRLAEVARQLGFRKVRLTGGEPLLRPELPEIIELLQALPDVVVGLTTNGTLLGQRLDELWRAGLRAVNVSLDSLNPAVYAEITGRSMLCRVLAGVEEAAALGLQIKLNVVVIPKVNDHELAEFAALTLTRPWQVRFIECMPFGSFQTSRLPRHELDLRLSKVGTLTPTGRDGVARLYRFPGARGAVGLIGWTDSQRCRVCNRLRVTASGQAYGCLYDSQPVDLAKSLHDPAATANALRVAVANKPLQRPELPRDPGLIRQTGG